MSNLLDKASIILTPTAYNNGEALCVKPSDGSGDFDFSRNSAATRVNAQGLVENVQILSGNLVQNGDFSEEGVEEVSNGSFSQEGVELITNGDFSNGSTDWDLGDGWSIGEDKVIVTSTINQQLKQTLTTTIGKSYKVSLEILDITEGSIRIYLRDGGTAYFVGGTYASSGVYDFYFTSTETLNTFTVYPYGTTTASITNISVKEVGQDWTLGTGWSIGEDKATFDETIGGAGNLNQSNILTVGKTYKLTFDTLETNGGNLAYAFGNNSVFINNIQADTTHVVYGVADDVFLKIRGASNFNGSITNISVKEVGQNWVLQPNASIGENKIICDNVSVNTNIAAQGAIVPVSKSVKLQYDIVVNSGTFRVLLGNGGTSTQVTTSGTYTFYETSGTGGSLTLQARSGGFDGSITNISIIEITTDTSLPRINYEGFSYQDALGSEEIVNGTFDSDTAWSVPNGADISNGLLNFDGSQSGAVNVNQSIPSVDLTKTYKVTFTISNYVSGLVKVKMSNNAQGDNRNSNGTYTEYLSGMVNNALSVSGNLNFQGSIDNVSVKEYLGQEVVPDSGCGSWLWEPQTSQLVTYSEDFSQWNLAGTLVLESGYLAPDGTNNATKVTSSDLTGFLTTQNGFLSSTTKSIYARSVSGSGTVKLLSKNDNTNNTFTLTEQWQRFDVNNTTSAPSLMYGVDFRNDATLNEIILWGANATNDQDYVTSYIPSNGSTVTRNQDVCNNGATGTGLINSTSGTLYFEGATLESTLLSGYNYYITISDGTSSNRLELRQTTSNIQFLWRVNGVYQNQIVSSGILLTDFNKIALNYSNSKIALWINGSQIGTINSPTLFPINTLNDLSFNDGTLGFPFKGKTKALAVWKEALSDSELQSLTTI